MDGKKFQKVFHYGSIYGIIEVIDDAHYGVMDILDNVRVRATSGVLCTQRRT